MRNLAQPRVLMSASLAALATALACYPRLSLWPARPSPLWYLAAVVLLSSIVLWGFVFAWHTRYAQRPVFTFRIEAGPYLTVTLTGVFLAILLHLYLDPSLRQAMPEDYPADLEHWLAMALFAMTFAQLFLLFAPFAWLMRLFRNRRLATALTVLFGTAVLLAKIHSSHAPISPPLLAVFLLVRIGLGWLSVTFYLRGGVLLSWWWSLLLETRLLLDLTGDS